jgi:hypothetical protein
VIRFVSTTKPADPFKRVEPRQDAPVIRGVILGREFERRRRDPLGQTPEELKPEVLTSPADTPMIVEAEPSASSQDVHETAPIVHETPLVVHETAPPAHDSSEHPILDAHREPDADEELEALHVLQEEANKVLDPGEWTQISPEIADAPPMVEEVPGSPPLVGEKTEMSPWEVEGISRATYYKRKKQLTAMTKKS